MRKISKIISIILILVLLTGCSNVKEDSSSEVHNIIEVQQEQIQELKHNIAMLSEENKKFESIKEKYLIELDLVNKENKQKDNIINNLTNQIVSNQDYEVMLQYAKAELDGLYYTFQVLVDKILLNSEEDFINYGLTNKYNPNTLEVGDRIGNWQVDELIDERDNFEITFIGLGEVEGNFVFNKNIDCYFFDIKDNLEIPVPIEHAYRCLYWVDHMDSIIDRYGNELNEELLFRVKVNKAVYSNGPILSGVILYIDSYNIIDY